jgi:hypothetical protein
MQRDLKPGTQVRCASGEGIVTIVRHSRNEVLIFFPSIGVGRWIDVGKVKTEPQTTNEESEAQL